MKRVLVGMMTLLAACGGSGNGHSKHLLHPAEFYYVEIPNEEQMEFLSNQLAYLNDPDRSRQNQALERIGKFELRAIPILLIGLERGHSSAQQGCLELLRKLKRGEATLRSSGKKIPNTDILGAWYLRELEQGYEDLQDPLDIGTGVKSTKQMRKALRANYRQQLCTLYQEVANPKYTNRFLDAIVKDDNELVRSAGYSVCAVIATSRDLPRLVEIYAEEEDLPQEFLWKTLKKMTNKNYPNDPNVWKLWLSRGSR